MTLSFLTVRLNRPPQFDWVIRKPKGRIPNDWTFATEDDDLENTAIGHLQDDTHFRRARLGVSDNDEKVNFKLELDFAQSDADFVDACMRINFDLALNV